MPGPGGAAHRVMGHACSHHKMGPKPLLDFCTPDVATEMHPGKQNANDVTPTAGASRASSPKGSAAGPARTRAMRVTRPSPPHDRGG